MNEQPPITPEPQPSVTPLPDQPAPQQTNLTPQQPKRRRLMALLIILAIIVVAGLTIGLLSMNDNKPVADAPKPAEKPMVMTAQQVIDMSKTYAADQFADAKTVIDTEQSPALKPFGSPTYIATSTAPNLKISLPDTTDDATSAAAVAKLSSYLTTEHKFTVTGQPTDPLMKTELQSATIICDLTTSTPLVVLNCEDKSAYEAVANELAPFAQALRTAEKIEPGMVLSGLKINKSTVNGYQNAEVNQYSYNGIGGAVALFYQNSDSDWKYFMSTQNELNCDVFNTDDLKSAFAGQKCFIGDTESVVTAPKQ
ncbi:MAG: hypothetical protein ABIR91_03655 [Candidatus Saccharimonadales bacterium]